MMNKVRNNNAYENEFWRTHNKFKYTLHIDYKPNIHHHIIYHSKQDSEVLIIKLIHKILKESNFINIMNINYS